MIGINISGAEFGSGGTHNLQYHYPTLSELQFYKDKGVDLVRLPFTWERMQPTAGGPLNATELALLKGVLADAAKLGMDVIVDLHNYGRYNGQPFGSATGPTSAQFADFWTKLGMEIKDFPSFVGYDLMNEPHDMPTQAAWKSAAQAATDAIRKFDMNNTIFVEGNNWSGAWSWKQFNNDFIINDPANKIVYQAHQYFDRDSSGIYSGTYDQEGAYPTVGVDRLKPFVEWLAANNLKGMIGEVGVPSNDPRWLEVMKNSLDYMKANNLIVTAWGGGTWWPSSYPMYMGTPGQTDSPYLDLLERHFTPWVEGGATALAPAPVTSTAPTTTTPTTSTAYLSSPTIVGTAGSDSLNGTGGVDRMDGREGNDSLGGSGGADVLSGGAGIDMASYHWSGAGVDVDLTRATQLYGDAHGDTLIGIEQIGGSGQADTLSGDAGANLLDGRGGNDVLNGRGGADVLTGGAGTDRFVFDSAADANGDRITDWGTGDILDFSRLDANANLTGVQGFTLIGSQSFSKVAGQLRTYNDGNNTYVAGDVNGDGVADFTLTLNGLHSSIPGVTPTGTTSLAPAPAPAPTTTTSPTTSPTTSTAYLSSPTIVGTAGSDTLNGTGGVDRMDGREGNDSLSGSGGADVLSGGAGIDMASYHWSGAGVDVDLTRATQLYGDAHGDTLIGIEQVGGSGHADTLRGDAGANLLDGRGGNDVLNGRGGADVLTGGAGADRFVFDSAADANGDRIIDWGTGDILDLRGIDANANLTGVQGFTQIGSQNFSKVAGQLRTFTEGTDTYVAGDVNGDGIADFMISLAGTNHSINWAL